MTVTVAELIARLMLLPQDGEVEMIGHCCGADTEAVLVEAGVLGGTPNVVLSGTVMGHTRILGDTKK